MQNDIKAVHHRTNHNRGNIVLAVIRTYAVALALVVLACVSGLAAWRMYGRMARASDGEYAAQHQLALLTVQQKEVVADVARLSTQNGVEGELRRRYGVAKPGEGVIQIVQPAEAATTTPETAALGVMARIWHVFFP